jgi:hypothetical protein
MGQRRHAWNLACGPVIYALNANLEERAILEEDFYHARSVFAMNPAG